MENAPFALDQIYISHGTMKVNGVDVTPNLGAAVLLVPSDVGNAVPGIHNMVISASHADLSLGGIPLSTDPLVLAKQ